MLGMSTGLDFGGSKLPFGGLPGTTRASVPVDKRDFEGMCEGTQKTLSCTVTRERAHWRIDLKCAKQLPRTSLRRQPVRWNYPDGEQARRGKANAPGGTNVEAALGAIQNER